MLLLAIGSLSHLGSHQKNQFYCSIAQDAAIFNFYLYCEGKRKKKKSTSFANKACTGVVNVGIKRGNASEIKLDPLAKGMRLNIIIIKWEAVLKNNDGCEHLV